MVKVSRIVKKKRIRKTKEIFLPSFPNLSMSLVTNKFTLKLNVLLINPHGQKSFLKKENANLDKN
jgi:hypothetical protein